MHGRAVRMRLVADGQLKAHVESILRNPGALNAFTRHSTTEPHEFVTPAAIGRCFPL